MFGGSGCEGVYQQDAPVGRHSQISRRASVQHGQGVLLHRAELACSLWFRKANFDLGQALQHLLPEAREVLRRVNQVN
ncbi:hypothetical protein D3C81_1863300 [compost metagenome]